VKKYIDELVKKTPSVQPQGDSDRDDLLPFITTFETQLKELNGLKGEISEKLTSLTAELESTEGDVQEACSDMSQSFLVSTSYY
jgi:hypothetical protein